MAPIRQPSEWRNWRALFASTLGIVFAMMYVYSLGVMIAPLEQAFGWTRTEIASGKTIMGIIGLVLAPFVGALIDRFGARTIALVGMPFYCVAFASLGLNNGSLILWQLQWGLIACGYVLCAPATWAAMTSVLFYKHRGLALAITLSGTGIAALFIPALTNWLLTAYGWRGAYWGLPLVLGATMLPVIWLWFKRDPAAPARTGHHAVPVEGTPQAAPPTPFARRVYLAPRFIMLAAAATIFSLAISVITLNSVPILISKGMSPTVAAEIAGVLGIGLIVGRIGGGYLIDRLPANRIAAILVLLPLGSIALLIGMPGQPLASILALILVGLATGAEYDACAYLAARHFGVENFGKLFGIISGLLIFSSSISPVLANYSYDLTRSYDAAIIAYIPAGLIAAVLFALIGPGPVRREEPIEPLVADA